MSSTSNPLRNHAAIQREKEKKRAEAAKARANRANVSSGNLSVEKAARHQLWSSDEPIPVSSVNFPTTVQGTRIYSRSTSANLNTPATTSLPSPYPPFSSRAATTAILTEFIAPPITQAPAHTQAPPTASIPSATPSTPTTKTSIARSPTTTASVATPSTPTTPPSVVRSPATTASIISPWTPTTQSSVVPSPATNSSVANAWFAALQSPFTPVSVTTSPVAVATAQSSITPPFVTTSPIAFPPRATAAKFPINPISVTTSPVAVAKVQSSIIRPPVTPSTVAVPSVAKAKSSIISTPITTAPAAVTKVQSSIIRPPVAPSPVAVLSVAKAKSSIISTPVTNVPVAVPSVVKARSLAKSPSAVSTTSPRKSSPLASIPWTPSSPGPSARTSSPAKFTSLFSSSLSKPPLTATPLNIPAIRAISSSSLKSPLTATALDVPATQSTSSSSLKSPLTAISLSPPTFPNGASPWCFTPKKFEFEFSDPLAYRDNTIDLEDEPEEQHHDIELTLNSKGEGDTADGVSPEIESNTARSLKMSEELVKFCVLESREELRLAAAKTQSENVWEEEKKSRQKGGMHWLWDWEYWAGDRVFAFMAMDIDDCGVCALERIFRVKPPKWVKWVPWPTDEEVRL